MRFPRKLTILAVAVVTLGVAGMAFAYWTTGGSGVGSATSGDVQDITISQTSTVAGLYPGGPAQNVATKYSNPNAGKVYVEDVTAAVDPAWSERADLSKPACTAADFSVSGTAHVGGEIVSGDSAGPTFTIAMNDLATNQDNCKNVTVDLVFSSN
jgi:hypothetical protein